jgi:hypothetical protein
MSDTTTVKITKDLRDQLAALGSKDDTFETIIQRLVKGAKR